MDNTLKAQTRHRQSILDRLRGRSFEATEPTQISKESLLRFDDPVSAFVQSLESVGGQAHFVDSPNEIVGVLEEIETFKNAQRVASTVPEAVTGNVDLAMVDDPHSLASLDWSIVRGDFIVAENGAIWIDGAKLPHRVLVFIAQYLAIVVSRSEVVNNLHEAYARIGQPIGPGFGLFASGPSKTADIEQSLVLGAHGCRKLQVFLLP